ncbi:MAG: hypothetical protein V1823_01930 [Chloroflexota bacterium]
MKMTPTDWIQAISMVVLVIVTSIYAWRTFSISKATQKQADASVKMAEDMRNARSPSLTIQWIGADPNQKRISAVIKNEGIGTALNLKCYLTHNKFTFTHTFDGYTTFEAGQKYPFSPPSENFDFETYDGLAINCDYESDLGDKFRSALKFTSKENRVFEKIKLTGGDKND